MSCEGCGYCKECVRTLLFLQFQDLIRCRTTYELNVETFDMIFFSSYLTYDDKILDVDLTHYDLDPQQYHDDKLMSLADALQTNKTLEELNLSYIKFTRRAFIYFAECLKDNTTLQTLILKSCELQDVKELAHINIRKLDLSHNRIPTESVRAVLLNPNLQCLSLYNCSINNESLELVAEVLERGYLTKLDIGCPEFTLAGFHTICNVLHSNISLRELGLDDFDLPLGDLILALQVNTTLKVLNLNDASYDKEDLHRLLECNLEELHIRGAPKFDLNFVKNSTLKTFSYSIVSSGYVEDDEVGTLAEIISENTILENLYVFNIVTVDKLRIIGQALSYNNTLENLHLSCNNDMDEYLDELIFPNIEHNYTIKTMTGFGNEANLRLRQFIANREERMEQHRRLAHTKRAL